MERIHARIIRIGNSKGFRIPKHVIEKLNIVDEIELLIDDDAKQILIKPIGSARKGWEQSFQEMHVYHDDSLLIDDGVDLAYDDRFSRALRRR